MTTHCKAMFTGREWPDFFDEATIRRFETIGGSLLTATSAAALGPCACGAVNRG